MNYPLWDLPARGLLIAFVAFGGAEFVREDLRKPYVIGEFMFVNGLQRRLPWTQTTPLRRDGAFIIDRVHRALLGGAGPEDVARQPGNDEGKGFFDENCGMCHSADGQWAIEKRPHRDADAFYEMLGRLPEINEMMPPFPGNDAQRRAVASHLATLTAGNPPATDKK